MNTHKEHLTNDLIVDRWARIHIAHLQYSDSESPRQDDCGGLYVAPIIGANFPAGLLAVYATTNGDPINIGQIEDGELTWFEGDTLDQIIPVLRKADWLHCKEGEGYSYLVMDGVLSEAERRQTASVEGTR